MSRTPGAYPADPERPIDPEPAARLAREWACALADTGPVPREPDALARSLLASARDLLAAAAAPDFDRVPAARAGAALVGAHFTGTGAVESTLAVLAEELGPTAGGRRLAQVQGALAAGYAHALQDRTRREQEWVSAAALAARAAAEQARHDSETRFRAVFAESVVGIGVVDTAGRFLEVNDALAAMTGHPASELLAGTIWTFAHPGDSPGLRNRIREVLAGERDHLRAEKAYVRPDGSELWAVVVLSLVRDLGGRPRYVVATVEDVTERHRLAGRLRHDALHDPLTGLPNRAVFFDRLAAALRAGHRAGVCYLDLDGFQAVNDTLGHDRGDALLRVVGGRLVDALGAAHLVARTGGDEFAVLVERPADAAADGAALGVALRAVAAAALAAVRRPVRLADPGTDPPAAGDTDGKAGGDGGPEVGREVVVTASAGVVQSAWGADVGEVMKAAGTTLSWAKADGGDRCAVFDEERHRRDVDRLALSVRMPEALHRGELHLEYQPLVRLGDRRMIGVEALVRWTLPDGRRLDPARFVPLAEDSGFIVALGRWVLERACRQAAGWLAADPAARLLLSVNLAARQVRGPELVDDVAAVLADTGWPPELLQLELTESALMGAATGDPLRALAAMGVRIAIDDFGTGYSNLAYLRRLPVSALKLAGPFVTGVAPDDTGTGAEPSSGAHVDREVAELVIQLAHTLGLAV
ncbi:MAG TPA: EAL domain-containing protein, partial [Pseudonocardia sp.]